MLDFFGTIIEASLDDQECLEPTECDVYDLLEVGTATRHFPDLDRDDDYRYYCGNTFS